MTKKRRKRQHAVRELINQLKNRPCAGCRGTFPPYVMHFDPRPGQPKRFCVTYAYRQNRTVATTSAEAQKCDVVCANCHAIRTFTRNQHRRVAQHLIQSETLFAMEPWA